MKLEITVKGTEKVAARIREVRDKYLEAVAAALYQEGFDIWREAVQRCPVETGLLRSSAYVAPPTGRSNPRVEVGFGTNYAIAVHENLEAQHPRGGEAKFLERTVDEHMGGYLQRLCDRAQENVGRGVGVAPLGAPEEPGA